MVPQGKLMDPGSLPPPDSEGKEPEREPRPSPPHAPPPKGPILGAPSLLPKRLALQGTLIPRGGSPGSLGLPLSHHHLHLTFSNSIIHPSDLFQDLSHFQETWLAEGE